jgi:hypothetical protein
VFNIPEMILEIVKIIVAVGAFLLLTCLVIRWALKGIIDNLSRISFEKAKMELNELKENALKDISNMLIDQKESFEDFLEQTKIEFAKSIEAANEDLNQRTKFVEIATAAQWRDLREQYKQIDSELRKWESGQNLEQSKQEAESIDELVKYLNNLKVKGEKVPEPTIELYSKRHRLFASLERFSQLEKTSIPRVPNVDFTLPAAPKLPVPASTASDSSAIQAS